MLQYDMSCVLGFLSQTPRARKDAKTDVTVTAVAVTASRVDSCTAAAAVTASRVDSCTAAAADAAVAVAASRVDGSRFAESVSNAQTALQRVMAIAPQASLVQQQAAGRSCLDERARSSVVSLSTGSVADEVQSGHGPFPSVDRVAQSGTLP